MNKVRAIINDRIEKEKEIARLNKIKLYEILKEESIKIIQKEPILKDFFDKS